MRKTFSILIAVLTVSFSNAQESIKEKEIKSRVDEVTVYLDGAQITRKKKVQLQPGTHLLKFTDLSPFIRSKSVQIKAMGDVTVLSVNHHQNFVDKLEKSDALVDLEGKLELVKKELLKEKAYLEVISEEIDFLKENKNIGGKNQAVDVGNLQSATNYYGQKMTELKMAEIERKEKIEKINWEKQDIEDQINNLSSSKIFAKGEVHVKIESKMSTSPNLELTYLVDNASWYPSYDIRAKNVNEPIKVVYKANVRQDTKIDWQDVKLKFSSANPSVSGVAPQLKTYFLDYYSSPPRYDKAINEVSGHVYADSDRLPLPGTSVIVKGTTIGTSTDFDGFFSLSVPNESSILEFSFVGFETKSVPVNSAVQNIYLEESANALEEVVVMGYSSGNDSRVSSKLRGKASGVSMQELEVNESEEIPLLQVENQTSVDFAIDQPYTVNSDNQSFSVDMVRYDLPADYQYYSVPKIQNEAFLLASITDWQKYHLLEGEANIFFENTFVGKTILDTRYASDTLEISLGIDKNVQVKRERTSDFSSKKFVGTKKEELREYRISVRNNKAERINMLVLDQVPVSRMDEIKVELLEKSKAKINDNSGEISWSLDLDPSEEIDLDLKYSVKYPKNRNLVIE
ncbi:mucoidy inhibitor MuiA family protein [Namhaeicola litoreus]|uniref:Mucoidy inhibitor MuiA family protein n=1 Tax=Namhaeicola litoreus TaxID=1052145 RepID=A0ABW3Y4H8_9FLAO